MSNPTVTFHGAAGTVTGSMHLLQANGREVLLDCGLYQGRRHEAAERNRKFPFRPRDIDAVILSHAHIDHCGNLPNLVKQGFRGPIFCTPASRALATVMLEDSGKIQEEDASNLNQRRRPGEPKVEPIYDARDVYRTLTMFKAVNYGKPIDVGPGTHLPSMISSGDCSHSGRSIPPLAPSWSKPSGWAGRNPSSASNAGMRTTGFL